jgi:hypothetical protein
MFVTLSGVGKLGIYLGVNEFLNICTVARSHAGKNRPLQLIEDEITQQSSDDNQACTNKGG